jgi:DNA-directed RNA polymerase subunit RPC12/RpoP
MAEQYCPNCGEESFSWRIDEEFSAHTQWHCSRCEYQAEENEALESECRQCHTRNLLYLKAGDDFFRFCTHCKFKSI